MFLTHSRTEAALQLLHLKCIPIFFLTGAGIVVVVSAAASIMFAYVCCRS